MQPERVKAPDETRNTHKDPLRPLCPVKPVKRAAASRVCVFRTCTIRQRQWTRRHLVHTVGIGGGGECGGISFDWSASAHVKPSNIQELRHSITTKQRALRRARAPSWTNATTAAIYSFAAHVRHRKKLSGPVRSPQCTLASPVCENVQHTHHRLNLVSTEFKRINDSPVLNL